MNILPIDHLCSGESPTAQYNNDRIAGTIYITNGAVGICASVASAAQTVFKEPPTPAGISLRRFFSVLAGVSNMISGHFMIQEAKKTNYVWGKVQGGFKVARGFCEAASGGIQGAVQAVKILATGISAASLNLANQVGDALFSIAMVAISITSLHNARLAGDIRRKLNSFPTAGEKLSYLHQLEKNRSSEESQNLNKILGSELRQIQSSNDQSLIDTIYKKLRAYEAKMAVVGTLCLLASAATVIGDIMTLGMLSKVISLIKPFIYTGIFYFDAMQFKSGVNQKSDTKLDVFMRYATTILAVAIAVGTFLAGNVATGGGLSIALLVIGVTMPIITLLISNKEHIKKAFSSIGQGISHTATNFLDLFNTKPNPQLKQA